MRTALQRGQLAGYVQLLTADAALLALWYQEGALLRSEDGCHTFTAALESLRLLDCTLLHPFSPLLDLANPFAAQLEGSKADRGGTGRSPLP